MKGWPLPRQRELSCVRIELFDIFVALLQQHVTIHVHLLRLAVLRAHLDDGEGLVVLAAMLENPLQHLERCPLRRPLAKNSATMRARASYVR